MSADLPARSANLADSLPKPKKASAHFRALMAARHDVREELSKGADMDEYLLKLARSAATEKEEAEVIMRAVAALMPETPDNDYRNQLMETARLVWAGFLPRPVLLGVVAALVPEGMGCGVNGPFTHADGATHWEAYCRALDWLSGHTPALALLIAIREASNG